MGPGLRLEVYGPDLVLGSRLGVGSWIGSIVEVGSQVKGLGVIPWSSRDGEVGERFQKLFSYIEKVFFLILEKNKFI